VFPETVQVPEVTLNAIAKPELAVAESAIGDTPYITGDAGAVKLIACDALVTVTVGAEPNEHAPCGAEKLIPIVCVPIDKVEPPVQLPISAEPETVNVTLQIAFNVVLSMNVAICGSSSELNAHGSVTANVVFVP